MQRGFNIIIRAHVKFVIGNYEGFVVHIIGYRI